MQRTTLCARSAAAGLLYRLRAAGYRRRDSYCLFIAEWRRGTRPQHPVSRQVHLQRVPGRPRFQRRGAGAARQRKDCEDGDNDFAHRPSFPQNVVNEYRRVALDTAEAGKTGALLCTKEESMNTRRLTALVAGFALLAPAVSMAQSIDELREMSPEERHEYIQSLSQEERQALAEQRRERWEAMTPEERDAARKQREENRAAMREHWESLSEEERAAAREQRRERMEQRRETWENMSDEEKAAARQHMRERRDAEKDARGERHKKRDGRPPQ